ncbi:hypothetical protein ACVWZB_003465 [Paenibacillus polymyxa]
MDTNWICVRNTLTMRSHHKCNAILKWRINSYKIASLNLTFLQQMQRTFGVHHCFEECRNGNENRKRPENQRKHDGAKKPRQIRVLPNRLEMMNAIWMRTHMRTNQKTML